MEKFLDLLEDCKESGFYKVLEHIKGAQPFVITTPADPHNYPTTKGRGIKNPKLDLPFKVCSFELTGNHGVELQCPGRPKVIVWCLVAEELSPEKTIFYAVGDFGHGREVKWVHPDDDGQSLWEILAAHLFLFLEQIQDGQHGTSSPRRIFKWKEKGEKKQIRINQVIHIRPRESSSLSSLSSLSSPGNVQWSHAFWVMGHWRTIKGIGKDREGVYRISGKTWVDAFVKQSELGDPVRKIRLLGDQD